MGEKGTKATAAGGDAFSSAKNSELSPRPCNFSDLNDAQKAAVSGQGGGLNVVAQSVSLTRSPDEKQFKGPNNTHICMAADRPGEQGTTGYESTPELAPLGCGEIWLCSGASHSIKNKEARDANGALLLFERNNNLDASTVTISACTDVDNAYNLADGSFGNSKGSAAICLKTDDFRCVARQSMKFITHTDKKNSNGGDIDGSISGIDLIAGNDDKDLQPMVKGNNLAAALEGMCNHMMKITATVATFAKHQNELNRVVKDHTHPDVLNMLVGFISGGGATSCSNGETLENPACKSTGEMTEKFISEVILKDCAKHQRNCSRLKKLYCGGTEKEDVRSKYNNCN